MMMYETDSPKNTGLIGSLLVGIASFLIAGMIAAVVVQRFDNYILAILFAGAVGGLLLGLFNRKQKLTVRMTGAGFAGVLLGFFGGFIIAEGLVGAFGLLFPTIAANAQNWWIADLFASLLMGLIFGAVFAAIVHGRKAIPLFSMICSAVALPFGLVVSAMNSAPLVRGWLEDLYAVTGILDVNLIVSITQFGAGAGLAMGLYHAAKLKHSEVSLKKSVF